MPHSNNGIVLIGNGGHARAVRDVIESVTSYSISLGGRLCVDRVIEDTRVLTGDDWEELSHSGSDVVIAIGQIKTAEPRINVFGQLKHGNVEFPTIISPHAYVSPTATIGQGVVIMHGAVVNARATVGDFCIVNTGATIEHDAMVGDFCHISTSAVVNGGASVRSYSFVGSGAIVLNQITIGEDVILGAGSVACCDILCAGTYRGNPAGKIK